MSASVGPSDHPAIECAAPTKTYELGNEKVHALRGVTFSIARGKFIAIMGASGSGKSTLANLIGALEKRKRCFQATSLSATGCA